MIVVSSANDNKLNLVELLMSWMYIMNNSGTNIDPCGTPQVTFILDDFMLKCQYIDVFLIHSFQNICLQSHLCPYFRAFFNSISWLIILYIYLFRTKSTHTIIFKKCKINSTRSNNLGVQVGRCEKTVLLIIAIIIIHMLRISRKGEVRNNSWFTVKSCIQ